MDARLFAIPKKSALRDLWDENKSEFKRTPAKVAIGVITAGTIAGIAYLASPWLPSIHHADEGRPATYRETESQHRIGPYTVEGPPRTPDIGLHIAHDPEFCRAIGKSFKAVWNDRAIETMQITASDRVPPMVLSRDQIASTYLECNARRKRHRGRR